MDFDRLTLLSHEDGQAKINLGFKKKRLVTIKNNDKLRFKHALNDRRSSSRKSGQRNGGENRRGSKNNGLK